MTRRNGKQATPSAMPAARWWAWRERWLDPIWHLAMAAIVPGAWVPPVWSMMAVALARVRPPRGAGRP